ncbi:MAG TPA: hypothetical protein VNO14_10510, partial [Blastocatellia bacterium]|nr:hypothetical protein [Blastocatellia bacterium]
PAVCIPPGARLMLRDIPEQLRKELEVSEEEEVTFVQLSVEAYRHRDGVRFKNGKEISLQRLPENERVDVLSLSPSEEAPVAEVGLEALVQGRPVERL